MLNGGDLSLASTGRGSNKWKKAIKGVLDKKHLTETYNCERQSKPRIKKKSLGNLSTVSTVTNTQTHVQSVKFNVAVVEDLLSTTATTAQGSNQHKKLADMKLIKHASQANLLVNREPQITKENQVEASNYEPNNSLRRVSCVTKPSPSQRKMLRRRSALDAPVFNDNILPGDSLEEYSSQNKLTPSDQVSQPSPKVGRLRRSGLAALQTSKLNIIPDIDMNRNYIKPNKSPSPYHTDSDSASEGSSVPSTPNTPRNVRPIIEMSIPENSEVSSVVSMSPKTVKRGGELKKRISSVSDLGSLLVSPLLSKKQLSSPNLLSKPTSLSSLFYSKKPNTFSSASSIDSTESSQAELSPVQLTPVKKIRTRFDMSHNNATRYWDWYILNASYSWQNFNTDKHHCY